MSEGNEGGGGYEFKPAHILFGIILFAGLFMSAQSLSDTKPMIAIARKYYSISIIPIYDGVFPLYFIAVWGVLGFLWAWIMLHRITNSPVSGLYSADEWIFNFLSFLWSFALFAYIGCRFLPDISTIMEGAVVDQTGVGIKLGAKFLSLGRFTDDFLLIWIASCAIGFIYLLSKEEPYWVCALVVSLMALGLVVYLMGYQAEFWAEIDHALMSTFPARIPGMEIFQFPETLSPGATTPIPIPIAAPPLPPPTPTPVPVL